MIKLAFEEKELEEFMQSLVDVNVPVKIFLFLESKIKEGKTKEEKDDK